HTVFIYSILQTSGNRQCRHKYRAGTLLFIAETPQLSRNASDQDKDNRRTKPGPDWPQKAGKGGGQSSVIIWINHAA
ncbi:hypothetical protein, partial [Klebsiella pneumoniae]|uniref:hypothetical protein n=1 Tax=Klebsiella pneumoniae TaxID=573 RepID=UPI001D0DDDCB